MRRVVVTGMGIVSSIGNNTRKSSPACARPSRHFARRGIRQPRLSQPRSKACRRSIRRFDRPARHALPWAGRAWNHVAMEQASAIPASRKKDISNPRNGIVMGIGRSLTSVLVDAADTTRKNKFARSASDFLPFPSHVVDGFGDARHLVQDQGVELFRFVGLRDLQSLHGTARTDPAGASRTWCRRRLPKSWHWTLSNMFDAMGAMSTKYNDTPAPPRAPTTRIATLRHRRGAGVLLLEELEHAKARRREDLRRDRRLWRDLGRPHMVAPSARARCAA